MADERVTEVKRLVKLADGKDYEVKPLSLLDTKKLLPLITKMDELKDKGISDELIECMADVCYEILKRATPELTRDKVLELVELESVYLVVLYGVGKMLK